jgi:S1-C subfamily serine protease
VFVEEVERNSPADKAQLPRGVLLAAINDQLTDSPNRAAMLLTSKRAGEHVRLSVLERRVSHNYFELRPRAVDVKVR